MNTKKIADLLFPRIDKTPDYYEELYPKRNLPEGAIVSRVAPSPTGFLHIGTIIASFIPLNFARQTNGVFFLRIEDTDQKREVEGGTELIVKGLNDYGLTFNEGPGVEGLYGPYFQSERKDIYQTFIKDLIIQGKAYPSFATEEELEELRKFQEANKLRIGYYGEYAKDRNLTEEEIIEKLNNKIPYVIRVKSNGDFNKRVTVKDLIKGEVSFPENDLDTIIMKQDGLPTYHFAHAIDDHLMRTTHVMRGDEWLSSVPVHLELFNMLGFELPYYCHLAPLTKRDDGGIRKISKRKDPEFAVSYYHEQGIPKEPVMLYLATIVNSNFEEWYQANPEKSYEDFTFTFDKMPVGGSLFDIEKLMSISKIYLSRKKAHDLYEETLVYAKTYQEDFAKILEKYKDYSINVLNIEREIERPRKDIGSYGDVYKEISYMYDEYFFNDEIYKSLEKKDTYDADMIKDYIENYYNPDNEQQDWFNSVKEFGGKYGYAKEMKDYKENPEKYKGNVADICEAIRIMVTGRTMSPNLYDILKLLGKDRILKRIEHYKNYIS